MSPVYRWHHPNCKLGIEIVDGKPGIKIVGGLPFCSICTSLPNCKFRDLQLPERPSIPSCDRLKLSWPASVVDRLRNDSVANDDFDTPASPSLSSAETTTASPGGENNAPKASQCPYYDYENLVTGDQFRVLELSQGQVGDPLHGILTTHHLREFAAYEALSYTWGYYDTARPEVKVDSKLSEPLYLGDFWDALPITRNCANALRSLRSRDRKRHIWVDSICVNQWNAKERGHQVALMGSIYENALSVVAYLGIESFDSSLPMQLLRIGKHPSLFTATEWSSINSLFKRPYFTRIWIIQEIAKAKSLHFYCGNSETFFNPFTELPFKISSAPSWLKYSRQQVSIKATDFLFLLEDTTTCQFSDPRDRIFALLGLLTAEGSQALAADYHLSVAQVYTGIAAFFLQSSETQFLRILRLAARSPASPSCPSWVPDWGYVPIFKPPGTDLTNEDQAEVVERIQRACLAIKEGNGAIGNSEAFRYVFGNIDIAERSLLNKDDYSSMNKRMSTDNREENKAEPAFCMRFGDPQAAQESGPIQISLSGQLTVRGCLLSSQWHSPLEPCGDGLFLLKNHGQTLNLLFKLHETCGRKVPGSSHPALFMLQNYSTILLLSSTNNISDQFSFLNEGKVDVFVIPTGQANVPESGHKFSLLPLSPSEWALLEGILSRPSRFPRFSGARGIWKEIHKDWVDWGFGPEDFVAPNLSSCYTTERDLWGEWQELETKGLAIIQSRATIDAVISRLQSIEYRNPWPRNNREWDEIKGGEYMIGHGVNVCWIANFLSLLILDPHAGFPPTLPSTTGGLAASQGNGNGAGPVLESDPLDVLRDWARLTLLFLKRLEDDTGIIRRFEFPGTDLLERARGVWNFHMSVASVVKNKRQVGDAWYTWFMVKRISRQRLENQDLGSFQARLCGEVYWDWNELRNVMRKRAELWADVNTIREQLNQELTGVNIESMKDKIATRMVLKEMDLPVDYEIQDEITII